MKLLNSMLQRFVKKGHLTLIDAEGDVHTHGNGEEPKVTIKLTDPSLYTSLFLNPELKAGEAYMDGTLSVEKGSIRDLLLLFIHNRKNLRGHPVQKALRGYLKKIKKWHQRNKTKSAAKKNVAHHYDISNELYSLFLDKDMQYSCAYFSSPEDSLEKAQQNKLRHIASKMLLEPGMRVLDIGCGWGGMAIYLAKNFGVNVVGVTLSEEQLALARKRVADQGLEDKVSLELQDYRNITGNFDRIVSVGMFEHVGLSQYEVFFRKIHELLSPDGNALLHSIGRKAGPGTTGAWVRKYIFPGGYSPALSETISIVEKTGLWITDIEILRLHYAETLKNWEERFQKNRGKITKMMDERFCRMWEFYLISAELTFRYGNHMVFQMQLCKNVDSLPLTRDYMFEAEKSPDQ